MRGVDGMSVLVTGGGSGIGEGTAGHFAARGARVTICGRREEKHRQVAADIGGRTAWPCRRRDRRRRPAPPGRCRRADGGGLDT